MKKLLLTFTCAYGISMHGMDTQEQLLQELNAKLQKIEHVLDSDSQPQKEITLVSEIDSPEQILQELDTILQKIAEKIEA